MITGSEAKHEHAKSRTHNSSVLFSYRSLYHFLMLLEFGSFQMCLNGFFFFPPRPGLQVSLLLLAIDANTEMRK